MHHTFQMMSLSFYFQTIADNTSICHELSESKPG